MALKARTTAETVPFYSKLDPSVTVREVPVDPKDASKGVREEMEIGEDASKFLIRPLDIFLMANIFDNASTLTGKQGSEEVGIKTRINQTNIDTVRYGLAGVPSDWDVPYAVTKASVNGRQYSAISDAVMESLGLELVQELAIKIKEISEVSRAEAKNSA